MREDAGTVTEVLQTGHFVERPMVLSGARNFIPQSGQANTIVIVSLEPDKARHKDFGQSGQEYERRHTLSTGEYFKHA